MKHLTKGAVVLSILTILVGGAFAQKPKEKAKTMTCPACHMAMPMKKSKATPVAVKTKNGTFYCCAGCAAAKSHKK
jgi:hypothetical protein